VTGVASASIGPAAAAVTSADREPSAVGPPCLWVERLKLTNFRNFAEVSLWVGRAPVVLCGVNGAGKTNLLEALSLLTSGQGLRRAPYSELAGPGGKAWSIWSRVNGRMGPVELGTGHTNEPEEAGRAGRLVRIDGQTEPTAALDQHLETLWITPALDGLFTGPAAERRRFLDRLVASFDPRYRSRVSRFERAMQQRNRLLADDVSDTARFQAFERSMAETGVAIAAARVALVAALASAIDRRRRALLGLAFPWAELAVSGFLENALARRAAVDVEDDYAALLANERALDRAAGRTREGPHRADLMVGHGDKEMPAKLCSTGEQKALLIGLILAQADLVAHHRGGAAPLLLLDEITAHLDPIRRLALFEEIGRLGGQAWLTGTDAEAFAGLAQRAQFLEVEEGRVRAGSASSLTPR
jgi:DNA replication and repair protein RecF